jgi:hypothetical protein
MQADCREAVIAPLAPRKPRVVSVATITTTTNNSTRVKPGGGGRIDDSRII